MGFGDALIAAAQAQEYFAQDPERGPIVMMSGAGKVRWNPVWLHNPVIWVPGSNVIPHRNLKTGGGYLPYLQHPYSTETGWRFTNWRVRDHRPNYYLQESERWPGEAMRDRLGPFYILEPTADRKHVNRRPLRAFWDSLATELQHVMPIPGVQLLHAQAEYLRGGFTPYVHEEFRQAVAMLAAADLLITTEGGLAHAAAAVGTPAVVLWGGNVSVDNLGYPEHVNLVDDGPRTPCGTLVECDHCAAAWARLNPSVVAALARQEWQRGLSRSRQSAVR